MGFISVTFSMTKTNHKKIRALLKGLTIRWHDKEPLETSSTVIPGKITHKNPVYRLLAERMWRDYGDFITSRYPMQWVIRIKLTFDYPNGTTQLEERELEARATISALNEHCMDAIREAMRCGAEEHYRHTEFEVECVG